MNLVKRLLKKRIYLALLAMILFSSISYAQELVVVKGVVVDDIGELIGASVVRKDDPLSGVITDLDGKFQIKVPKNTTLVISCIGMASQEVVITSNTTLKIELKPNSEVLDEVVFVGYGQQKKASVVGAIVQASGETLQRTSGVPDISSALTGNLPGVVTTASSGMPGEEDPQIVIRGASSWNNSSPLILVDGIERTMSSVDMGSVASISVLKDASATAVYGVKGANGVILITTKRGEEGRAQVNVAVNSTMKSPSQLPTKFDSYDALRLRNQAIEHELGISPNSWSFMTPQSVLNNYRNQTSMEQMMRYPNVDWEDVMFKDFAMSYNASVNVSGGSDKLKYFVAADYQKEGDLFEQWDAGRGYGSAYTYDRINFRTNLDYKLTPSTTFSMNLAGSTAIRRSPWAYSAGGANDSWQEAQRWAGAYGTPPDAFLPQYEDGTWGFYSPNPDVIVNPVRTMATSGDLKTTTIDLKTDFSLNQNLDMITKGLSARAMISWDNVFVETSRGINDNNNSSQVMWVNPEDGSYVYREQANVNTGFDFNPANKWETNSGYIAPWLLQRRLFYQGQINYNRKFDLHSVSALGVFNRQEYAYGSQVPSFREDWAFRVTYDYASRYFFEYNGAYNGSEKFAAQNRFAFFNSGAIGWTITEEKFMKKINFLSYLKLRASYGEIGDDNTNGRWLFQSQWAYGGQTSFTNNPWGADVYSPYTWYSEKVVGNEDIHWETVTKLNIGADYSLFDGLLAGSFDWFRDRRDDILINGEDRSIPLYYGAKPPTVNAGIMETNGYEFEVRFNKVFKNQSRIWANFNLTHAENKIIKRADAKLSPDYQKDAGYSLNQNRDHISADHLTTYDQIFGSTSHDVYDSNRLPGDYRILDYNCDGIIDKNDAVPFGFTSTPQNTFSFTLGGSYKNWSAFVQFYGVTNVTREVFLNSFDAGANNVYDLGNWWSPNSSNADVLVPRYLSTSSPYTSGTQYTYDGSYLRLKNLEIAYTLNSGFVNEIGIKDLKIYINGNNLWLWSRMPDDRESNFGGASNTGAYPMMRRVNLGIKLTL